MQTGAYVYASPAVTNAPGLGPTIYIGSYSGTFYAINARSGQISWRFDAHGRISGSATIIGRTVYFADLGRHRTFGLGISTGRVLFEKGTGAFDPMISDGVDVYLTGDTGLYGLAPAAQPSSTHTVSKTRRSASARAATISDQSGGRDAATRAPGGERTTEREARRHDHRTARTHAHPVHPPGAGDTQPAPRVSVQ